MQPVGFELLDVYQPVDNASADLGVVGSAADPAPAFQCPVRELPPTGQLDLIDKEVCYVHLASPGLGVLRGEAFHGAALRAWWSGGG